MPGADKVKWKDFLIRQRCFIYYLSPAKSDIIGLMIRHLPMDLMLVLTSAVFLLLPGTSPAEGKITIGTVEDVILLPWGVKLPARIDTGAAKSSLDARELKIENDMVAFKLPEQLGGMQLRLPIIEWRHVRSPDGRQRRPVVEMEFCLGPKRIRNKVNLNDRSFVKYPLILGRNFLKDHFVVDVKRRKTIQPKCREHSLENPPSPLKL
jgi:hypothetical protein